MEDTPRDETENPFPVMWRPGTVKMLMAYFTSQGNSDPMYEDFANAIHGAVNQTSGEKQGDEA